MGLSVELSGGEESFHQLQFMGGMLTHQDVYYGEIQ
jgi:hypothetical protein